MVTSGGTATAVSIWTTGALGAAAAYGRYELTFLDWQLEAGRDRVSRLRYHVRDLIQDMQKQIRQSRTDTRPIEDQQVEEELEAIAVALEEILADEHEEVEAG